MITAKEPFKFVTAAYLTCVENQAATSIAELLEGLDKASDGAIFYHTFQALGRYHFLTEGFSNDFAQWVQTAFSRPTLAERLASVDVRNYVSVAALREDIKRIVADFCERFPAESKQRALEPFYFCSAVEVTVPLMWETNTLAGFRANVERLSHASFYHHFIASRLRLQLSTNDFSHWFANALGLEKLAQRTNRIDIYTNTLDTARTELVRLVERELAAERSRT
jgi:hypothetical protein